MNECTSVNGIKIRLTTERWFHISQNHPELAGYFFDILECVQHPQSVRLGSTGEMLAQKELAEGKILVVVYREEISSADGFVITAFLTKRQSWLEKKRVLWP